MHIHKTIPHLNPVLRCDYDRAYESMYDSSYGPGFVFYEEEYVTDDGYNIANLPAFDIAPSGSSQA